MAQGRPYAIKHRARTSTDGGGSCPEGVPQEEEIALPEGPAAEEGPSPSAGIWNCPFALHPNRICMAHASQATARNHDFDRTAAHRDKPYPGHYRREMRSLANHGFQHSACDRH